MKFWFSAKLWPALGLAVIAGLYLILTLAVSRTMPFSRALDEEHHLEYVTFIKENGRLPISYDERSQITRADFPPLYHLLVTALSSQVELKEGPDFKYFWDSFRYRVIDHYRAEVWSLETEDFQPPYVGRFLVWQIGRRLSIFLSLITLFVVFLTLRELPLGPQPWMAVAGTAILAFIPRYVLLGSALNDDNLLGPLAALYFLMLVKAVKRPTLWWPFIGMGLALGLSMTVKYTLVVIPLEIVVIVLFLAKTYGLGRAWAWGRIGLVGVLAGLSASWWFGWNIWFLNTAREDGWLVGILRPVMGGGSDQTLNRIINIVSDGQIGLETMPENVIVGTFSEAAWRTFLTFWGVEPLDAVPGSIYFFVLISLILIVVAYGLWRGWQMTPGLSSMPNGQPQPVSQEIRPSSFPQLGHRAWLLLLTFHIGLFFILPLIRFILTRRLSVAAQGRHILIPAAAAVVALLMWGLVIAVPRRWQTFAFAVLVALFVAWSGLHLYDINASARPALPLRTSPQAAEWLAEPIHATFGEALDLVSYEVDPQPDRGRVRVDLAWRSGKHVAESYLLKIILVDPDGTVLSHWIGYNGQGRLPTLGWDPGDVIFDRLFLPLFNLPLGNYTLQIQMLGQDGPLTVKQAALGQSDLLPLTTFTVDQPPFVTLPKQIMVSSEDGGRSLQINYGLWRADGAVEAGSHPTYRYPATISVVTAGDDLEIALVDPQGQIWPATHSEAGLHVFVIGPRWPSGLYQIQLTQRQGEQVIGQIVSEAVLTVENWWERDFTAPDIAAPAEANFADQIYFLGYKLPQTQVKAGQAFPLTLYWQAPPEKAPQAEFTQFNHFLDSSGTRRGGYDRQPLEYYNTLLWAPGEVVIDGYAIPVEADAPPGQYYLNVGYYLSTEGNLLYLPLVAEGQMTDVRAITIGPIEVVEGD